MSYILNIDTAVEFASVCISKDGELVKLAINEKQREQAAWLQPGIKKLLEDTGLSIRDLSAIAVSIGPGSYTGLRIGLSSAKGLCYALNIPLITISTLDMMAAGVCDEKADFICPMIDARRMEVYTAVYDKTSARVVEPNAMILTETAFENILNNHTILFFGNGSKKFKPIALNKNAMFSDINVNASGLIKISGKRFHIKDFNNLAYTEPMYIKEFYSSVR